MYSSGVRRLGIRELRADLAACVRAAGAGERIVVTVDGRAVAELGPVGGAASAVVTLEDLAARGLVTLPVRTDRVHPPAVEAWPGLRLDRVLRDVR
jgi:antitoxin (DNA-binding transcriptional repressor) of toxin-antitoxin stability system